MWNLVLSPNFGNEPVVAATSVKRGHKKISAVGRSAGLLIALIAAITDIPTSTAADQRPNIIVILVDDMGYSDVGCYGSEIRTPHIDQLAADGLRMTQFYNTAKCYTTRASLLTGLYHQQALDDKILSRRGATIAEVLTRSGYRTAMSGKWHLNGPELSNSAFQPPARGFDDFFGTIIGANSYFEPYTLQRGNNPIQAEEGFYYTDAISDHAVSTIRTNSASDAPFFHYIAFTAPHWPMHIPADEMAVSKYRKVYAKGWDEIRRARFEKQLELGVISESAALSPRDSRVSEFPQENLEWHIERMAVYAAMIERLDRAIGKVVSELDALDELDNSVIMFLSDNGGSPEDIGFKNGLNTLGGVQTTRAGEKIQIGRDQNVLPGGAETYQGVGRDWANVNNTPFRQFKTFSHEGGISTPFIVRWPGITEQRGAVSHQVAHLIDIMPTCLEAAGADYPANIDGHSLLPLEGRSLVQHFRDTNFKTPRTLFWNFGNHAAARKGDWKLVALSARDRNWELYNLRVDRSELNDLLDAEPERANRLIQLYDQWANRVGVLEKQKTTKTKKNKR